MKNTKNKPWRIIGLMSGTSMDSIDAVMVEIDRDDEVLKLKILADHAITYRTGLATTLFQLISGQDHATSLAEMSGLHFEVGKEMARTVDVLLQREHISPCSIDLIACHGQTIWHQPTGTPRSTWQLGTPAFLAQQTGITTISDFRANDLAAGGQGAPLVCLLDQLLFRHPTQTRVLLNIGGIANITCLPPVHADHQQVIAFDTGPGNSLIDAAIFLWTHGAMKMDTAGQWAARGKVHELLLERLHQYKHMSYLDLKPPKTTGKEQFGWDCARYSYDLAQNMSPLMSPFDFLATLTDFTANTIAQAIMKFLPPVDEIIASGGGVKNKTLIRNLHERLPGMSISTSDQHGLPAQQKEALAFAVLGYHTIHGWPGNVPACTGAHQAVALGSITPGKNFLDVLKRTQEQSIQPACRAILVPH